MAGYMGPMVPAKAPAKRGGKKSQPKFGRSAKRSVSARY